MEVPKTLTIEAFEAVSKRLDDLNLKNYSKWDAGRRRAVGLSSEEETEYRNLLAWKLSSMKTAADYYQDYCRLKKGDLVEATFEDGPIIAEIQSEIDGGQTIYTISLPGKPGGRVSIQPHKVRKLSALEVFALKVDDGSQS